MQQLAALIAQANLTGTPAEVVAALDADVLVKATSQRQADEMLETIKDKYPAELIADLKGPMVFKGKLYQAAGIEVLPTEEDVAESQRQLAAERFANKVQQRFAEMIIDGRSTTDDMKAVIAKIEG